MLRLFRAITNPNSFWREVVRCGFLERHNHPESWLSFRHSVGRECAMRKRSGEWVPSKSLDEILGPTRSATGKIVYDAQTPYNLSWAELVILSQIVASLRPLQLFEIGTFNGRTTLHLALNAPDNALVTTVDLGSGEFNFGADKRYFASTHVGSCFQNTEVAKKIVQVLGDSHSLDFSACARSMDLVFIDGDHSYAGVMKDSELAFSLIRPGGVILWHDYLMIGDVTRAISSLKKIHSLYRIADTSLVICMT